MPKNKSQETQVTTEIVIRIKKTERECPRCEAMLIMNENEQCYECLNCGYIDCGDD